MIWTRSSRCDSANCVEVHRDGSRVVLRNSTDPDGLRAVFEAGEWDALLDAIKAGDPAPGVLRGTDGSVLVFEPEFRRGMPVRVTWAEWAAFRDGVVAGDMDRGRVPA